MLLQLSISDEVRRDDAFQRVVHTGDQCQILSMTLQVGEDSGHLAQVRIDQTLTVVEGTGQINLRGIRQEVRAGDLVVVPAGVEHCVTNIGQEPLRLLTTCTLPTYPPGMMHQTRANAHSAQLEADGQPPAEEDRTWVTRFDMSNRAERFEGLELARTVLGRGELVVMPTDTVYGVGAEGRNTEAVASLLRARGCDHGVPVPLLVGSTSAAEDVAERLSGLAAALTHAFWPGALTLICRANQSLQGPYIDSEGRVAIRMPRDDVALDLLDAIGPMAVSGAHRSGVHPATTVDEAISQLGSAVSVYLDGSRAGGSVRSTIVDVTGDRPRLLREGVVREQQLREVVGDLAT